ncbi:F-box/LRR-repeat protein At3g03360-like [Salvia hispanica]|uniref:F-box/LRR-repeat protein At3g03360-like n=1 Tax=Salvia hispanica TaxID=49212 RepID=UPI0020093103|nr:F-box/LRR-repeat protein At3g03360-like [Salvia hispanica]
MARVQRRRLKDDYTDDRISMLPNDILVLILSSLSFKEAMATSSLSSRWKNLWMLTSKLDFHIDFLETIERRNYNDRYKFGIQCIYVKWVDHIFTRLRAVKPSTNVVEFRLSFDLTFPYFAPWINDWLRYAVSRKAERLDLILVAYQGERRYSFPYKEGNFPANLKLLKKLRLHYVNVSGEAVAFILGSCRLLEQLSLHETGVLSSLEVVGTSPLFKCLEISECMSLKSVVVRGSELVCIKYKGVGNLASCRFVLVNVPLLTQLWIQAEPYFPDLIAMYKMPFEAKMMPNLKQFVVVLAGSDYCDECSLMPWFSVISAPCLERVVVEFVEYGTALDKVIVDPRSFKHRWHMPWDRIYRNHMEDETFVKDWKCDLTNKSSKAFQSLRAKFVTAMVYSNENKVIDYMMRTTTSHMKEAQSKGTVDVEKMVANFPKP